MPFGTWEVCSPECFDDVDVEHQHEDEGEDVQDDSLEDVADKASVVTPVRNTACQVPEDILGNTRMRIQDGDGGQTDSLWQADQGGDAPDDGEEEDHSALAVGEGGEGFADGWEDLVRVCLLHVVQCKSYVRRN